MILYTYKYTQENGLERSSFFPGLAVNFVYISLIKRVFLFFNQRN